MTKSQLRHLGQPITDSSTSQHQRSIQQTPYDTTSASPSRIAPPPIISGASDKLPTVPPPIRQQRCSARPCPIANVSDHRMASPSRIAQPPNVNGARDNIPWHHLGQPIMDRSTSKHQRSTRQNHMSTTSASAIRLRRRHARPCSIANASAHRIFQ